MESFFSSELIHNSQQIGLSNGKTSILCSSFLYLDLEALHVVIAHPLVSLVGIWHILGLVPNLSCSAFQKVTDL